MTTSAYAPPQQLARALEHAGFGVEVIGFNPVLWRISLDDTCFQAIPRWNGVDWDLFLQLTPSDVHECDWYRYFHKRLADALTIARGASTRHATSGHLDEERTSP